MFVRPNLISLILAVTAASSVAAPIDSKTEHLGLKLGSSRSELRYKVLQETEGPYNFQFVKSRPGMQPPKVRTVQIQVPSDATFGGSKIEAIGLAYLSDYLCMIHFEFQHLPYSAYKESVDTTLEALKQKYGPPTHSFPDGTGNGPLGRRAFWTGDDVECSFTEFPGPDNPNQPAKELSISLRSKRAIKDAEQETVRRFDDEQRQIQQKAKDVHDL